MQFNVSLALAKVLSKDRKIVSANTALGKKQNVLTGWKGDIPHKPPGGRERRIGFLQQVNILFS